MRYLSTILLSLLALLCITVALFLTIDGNLARLTGWYRFEKGKPLFSNLLDNTFEQISWVRISDLSERIECTRDEHGEWWLTYPFTDRVSPEAIASVLNFAQQARIVDTLPMNNITRSNLREFGVESSPYAIVLKVPDGNQGQMTTVARFTLGSTAPWMADVGDGEHLVQTSYLRTDFYGRDKRIHVVSGNILGVFKDGLYSLRDPSPLRLDADSVQSIQIKMPGDGNTLNLLTRPSPQANWSIISPLHTPANQEQVESLLTSLLSLRALRVDDKQDVTLPAENTATRITLATQDNRSFDILLYPAEFSEKDDSMITRATVSDRDAVFTLQAAPRIARKGSYSRLITNTYALPVLPESAMAKIRTTKSQLYTADLPLNFSQLRSMQFCELLENDISRLVLQSRFSDKMLRLINIPGNIASKVDDLWMFSLGEDKFSEAEAPRVKTLIRSLSEIPVTGFIEDVPLSGDGMALMVRHALQTPDYVLSILPKPSAFRSRIFGLDVPIVKDRQARRFHLKRSRDESGKRRWIGAEWGGHSVVGLDVKLTRQLSLLPQTWKSRQLLRFPLSALRRITMGYQQAPLFLDYDYIDDKWSGMLGDKDISPQINPHRALGYLKALQGFRVLQWLDDEDEDALETLKTPHFSVKLDLEIKAHAQVDAVILSANNESMGHYATADELIDAQLTEGNDENARRMRELAFADFDVEKRSITVQIAPMTPAPKSDYYGRIVETGELFILPHNEAMSLGISVLD